MPFQSALQTTPRNQILHTRAMICRCVDGRARFGDISVEMGGKKRQGKRYYFQTQNYTLEKKGLKRKPPTRGGVGTHVHTRKLIRGVHAGHCLLGTSFSTGPSFVAGAPPPSSASLSPSPPASSPLPSPPPFFGDGELPAAALARFRR